MSKKQPKKKPDGAAQKGKREEVLLNSRLQEAVKGIAGLDKHFNEGLGAVKGAYRARITAQDPHLFNGSLDIDKAKAQAEPTANRWDYAIEYNGEVFFVEVHSGATSDVPIILKKLEWLKQWLKNEAKAIDKLKTKRATPYFWIHTGGCKILQRSITSKQFAQSGITIRRVLNCDELFGKSRSHVRIPRKE